MNPNVDYVRVVDAMIDAVRELNRTARAERADRNDAETQMRVRALESELTRTSNERNELALRAATLEAQEAEHARCRARLDAETSARAAKEAELAAEIAEHERCRARLDAETSARAAKEAEVEALRRFGSAMTASLERKEAELRSMQQRVDAETSACAAQEAELASTRRQLAELGELAARMADETKARAAKEADVAGGCGDDGGGARSGDDANAACPADATPAGPAEPTPADPTPADPTPAGPAGAVGPAMASAAASGKYKIAREHGASVTLAVVASEAGYDNSVGHYFADGDGVPICGRIDFTNAKGRIGGSMTAEYAAGDIPATAVSVGLFVVPNGARLNPLLPEYVPVVFSLSGETDQNDRARARWEAQWNGEAVRGEGAPALFSDAALNPDGSAHANVRSGADDTDAVEVAFEDLLGFGAVGGSSDTNYRDVVVSVRVAAFAGARSTVRYVLSDVESGAKQVHVVGNAPPPPNFYAGPDPAS